MATSSSTSLCPVNGTANFIITENMTESYFVRNLFYSYVDRIVINRVLPLIFGVGVTGNIAFLFCLLRVKWMRTVTNYYLANLALADISFLVVVVGEKIYAYNTVGIAGHMAFGRPGCIITNFLRRLIFFASLFLVTLVSLERFYAICKPVQHWMLNGKKQTVKLVFSCWFLSSVFAAVLIPSNSSLNSTFTSICLTWPDIPGYRDLPARIYLCHFHSEIWLPISEGIQIVPFVIALVTNTVLYARMINNLRKRAAATTAKSSQSIEIRNQVARMLVINGCAFFICLAPYQITSFIRMINSSLGKGYLLPVATLETLIWVFRMMVYLNSVLNPIIYTATSPRYRHGFLLAFSCGKSDSRKTYTSVPTSEARNSHFAM